MFGLGIDVHVVDGVFAQLRANTGSGGRSTGGGERGDAVCGAGLHQQRAADSRREPDRPIESHLERRASRTPRCARSGPRLRCRPAPRRPMRRLRASPALRPLAPDAACAVSSPAAHRANRVRPRAAADVCRRCGPAEPALRDHRSPASTRSPPRRVRPRRRGAQRDRRSTRCPTAQCVPDRRRAAAGRRQSRRGSPGVGVVPTRVGAATRPTRRTRGNRTTPRLIRQRRTRAHSPSRRWCRGCPRIPVPSPRTALRPHRRTHRRSRRNAKRRNGRGHW